MGREGKGREGGSRYDEMGRKRLLFFLTGEAWWGFGFGLGLGQACLSFPFLSLPFPTRKYTPKVILPYLHPLPYLTLRYAIYNIGLN